MDLFVVPTVSFRLLYGLLIMRHSRRQILWFGVTAHPTAEWLANQLMEACGWERAPQFLIRDRECLLWSDIHAASSIAGHPRSPDSGPFAKAKWLRGTPDWIGAAGMP